MKILYRMREGGQRAAPGDRMRQSKLAIKQINERPIIFIARNLGIVLVKAV